MGERIGLDFGTTYSMAATLSGVSRDRNGNVKDYEGVITLKQTNAQHDAIDTIVSKDINGKMKYGWQARTTAGRPGVKIYRGFKMLLSEASKRDGEARLSEYGFADENEPAVITKYYLESILEKYRSDPGGIEKVVVGVPEVWFRTSINSRSKLKQILEEIVGIGKVQLESEPKLACAYFLQKFRKREGKDFEGHILLIDYGGGTLDIAVCSVKMNGGKPEIGIECREGKGANGKERKLGDAGMAFFQAVLERALVDQGINKKDIVINESYYKCMHDIEDSVKAQGGDIEEEFNENADSSTSDVILCEVYYGADPQQEKRRFYVKYGMLYNAYYDVIEKPFTEALDTIKSEMDKKGIKYNSEQTNFKIAMVGGFSNFCLTRETVKNSSELAYAGRQDSRYADFEQNLADENERERAIAYGAALMANAIVLSRTEAPYTLSIHPRIKKDGELIADLSKTFVAFKEGQGIKFDEPIFVKKIDSASGKELEGKFRSKSIPFVNMTVGGRPFCDKPIEPMRLPSDSFVKLAFSLDNNYILTLHVYDFGQDGNNSNPKHTATELMQIEDLLGGLPFVED